MEHEEKAYFIIDESTGQVVAKFKYLGEAREFIIRTNNPKFSILYTKEETK